jgi:predicted Zn finger-like uncharacterized protein
MILPCPACMARFMVPDERITRKGVKIRCPKCRFVFIMKAGTDKKKRQQQAQESTEGNHQAATSGAIGETSGSMGSAAGAIGATGTIGEAGVIVDEAAVKKKRQRRAPVEGMAKNISGDELAHIEDDEIVDMDDLAQATEQSGMAIKADPKLEHLLPKGKGGPSVVLDNSILAAAAAYTAAMGDNVETAHSVSDTLMDFGPRAVDDDLTPPARPASLAVPPPAPTPHDAPAAAASDLPPPAPTPYDDGAPTSQSESPTPRQGFQAAQTAADDGADDFEVDLDLDLDEDEDDDILTGAVASDSAALSMPTTFTMTALAPEYESLSELEGLLVEEKAALRMSVAAKIILAISIVAGIALVSLLGTLIYARVNPPKAKPPSWGNLQLSNLKHNLFERKDRSWIVRVEVHVKNASKRAKYRNVNLKAQLLDPAGQAKCENFAPCGLYLSPKEFANISRKSYKRALKIKAKSHAYNVQLNPGQGERCQVLLFCGKSYDIGQDKIKVAIDKPRSTRLAD